VDLALAQSTSTDTRAHDHNSLLGLVANTASRVDASWLVDSVHDRLPAPLCHAVAAVVVREGILGALPNIRDCLIH